MIGTRLIMINTVVIDIVNIEKGNTTQKLLKEKIHISLHGGLT